MQLQPNYIIDSHNHKIAVQLDIQTYEKITNTLENYALYQYMQDNKEDDRLSLKDAKKYYQSLKENAS
jgi:hypothetical protein